LPIDETPFDFGERRDAACFFGATLRQGGTDLSISDDQGKEEQEFIESSI
jgi:hypothetical protein